MRFTEEALKTLLVDSSGCEVKAVECLVKHLFSFRDSVYCIPYVVKGF